jgi:AcrR family transcriptional regulator
LTAFQQRGQAGAMMSLTKTDERSSRGLKRTRVLDAAAKALNRRGVSQASLAEIAESIGLSRAALYYYFEDQEDLVFQCYRRSCELMANSLNDATSESTDALAVIEAFIDGLLAEEVPEIAALSEVAFLRPEQQSTILRAFESVRTDIAEIIKEGVCNGQLRPCAPGVVAASIIGLVSWLPMARRLPTTGTLSNDDLVEALKAMLRVGVAADRRAPVEYRPFELLPISLPALQVFDADVLAAARKEALTAAASWLFNLKGVDATSLEEIALRVGVTKKVIYHNIGDKETLVAECFHRSFRFYENSAQRMRDYDGPRIDAICAGVHERTEATLREDISPLAPLAGFEETLPKHAKEDIENSGLRLQDKYLEIYAKGQAEGSVREVNVQAILQIHTGSFKWLPKWFDTFRPAERAAAPREVAELLRLGLSPL